MGHCVNKVNKLIQTLKGFADEKRIFDPIKRTLIKQHNVENAAPGMRQFRNFCNTHNIFYLSQQHREQQFGEQSVASILPASFRAAYRIFMNL